MKVSEQCETAASKGKQIIRLIKRNITGKKKELIIHLDKSIVTGLGILRTSLEAIS